MTSQIKDDERRIMARLITLPNAQGGASPTTIRNAEDQNNLLERLRRALNGERERGLAGHWSFDANRYIGLLQAYRKAQAKLRPPDGKATQISQAIGATENGASGVASPRHSEAAEKTRGRGAPRGPPDPSNSIKAFSMP